MTRFKKNINDKKEQGNDDLDLTHEDEEDVDAGFDPEERVITLGKHAGGGRALSKGLQYPSLVLARRSLFHTLSFGITRSGKTETNFRIAYLIARYTNWPMVFLDAKGSTKGAERWGYLMTKAGRPPPFVFPNEHFDGFRGSPDEIFNCFMQVIPFVMRDDPARYYTDKAIVMLRIICDEYDEPPRSSRELLVRLTPGMMNIDIQTQIESEGVDPKAMLEVKMRFAAYFRQIKNLMDGKLYWSEFDNGYFIFDSLGGTEEAMGVAAYIFKSLTQYLKNVKPGDQPLIVFIDEAAAIVGSTSLALLSEQALEFEVALYIILQTLDGFPEEEQARILGNAAAVLIHKTNEPERLANLVAQKLAMEMTLRHEADDPGELNLQYQMQKVLGLDVDAIKLLKIGEMWGVKDADSELVRVGRSPRGKLVVPTIEPVEFLGLRVRPNSLPAPPEAAEDLDEALKQAREKPVTDWTKPLDE